MAPALVHGLANLVTILMLDKSHVVKASHWEGALQKTVATAAKDDGCTLLPCSPLPARTYTPVLGRPLPVAARPRSAPLKAPAPGTSCRARWRRSRPCRWRPAWGVHPPCCWTRLTNLQRPLYRVVTNRRFGCVHDKDPGKTLLWYAGGAIPIRASNQYDWIPGALSPATVTDCYKPLHVLAAQPTCAAHVCVAHDTCTS